MAGGAVAGATWVIQLETRSMVRFIWIERQCSPILVKFCELAGVAIDIGPGIHRDKTGIDRSLSVGIQLPFFVFTVTHSATCRTSDPFKGEPGIEAIIRGVIRFEGNRESLAALSIRRAGVDGGGADIMTV